MIRKSAKRAADRAEMVQWLFENSRDLMHVISRDGLFRLVFVPPGVGHFAG